MTDPVSKPWRFTLRRMFLWVFVAGLLFASCRQMWHAISAARFSARRSEVRNELKQVLLGLHNFNDTYRHLPPANVAGNGFRSSVSKPTAGPPLHSWRFVICPYLESHPWPYDFSKPWNDPSYAQWKSMSFRLYCRPGQDNFATKFVSVTGPDTAWGDGTQSSLNINDLPNDLILVVETRNSGLHWMQPGDFNIHTLLRTINAQDGTGISSDDPAGVFVGLADASVRFVPSDLPFEKLESFFTISGAAANDIDEVLP